jgi:hypothetical protein
LSGIVDVLPSANRLIGSLRDIGYDLPVAMAELVDNSIAAGAKTIQIDTEFAGASSWIRLADDGLGMSEKTLLEAMRFGTRRVYTVNELGKFGLGLKAASLSQCRHLTVATRTSIGGPTRVARWDLDHIEATDRWEVIRLRSRDCQLATVPLRNGRGTVVLWERLDRILRFKSHDGQRASNELNRLANEVEQHLAMVFHRFLGRETRRRLPLTIAINGRSIDSWDPFARQETDTQVLHEQKLALVNGQTARIAVRPYVLPSEAGFSTPMAHRVAAGPRRWNRQQGFYFYRNDRMIQGGGWNRLRTSDEHTKLARISVDFLSSEDQLFELNVSKTQVRVPQGLRAELATIASSVARVAQDVYRGNSDGSQTSDSISARLDAVRELIGMVIAAVRESLTEELDPRSAQGVRIARRISKLERSLVTRIVNHAGAQASPNGEHSVIKRSDSGSGKRLPAEPTNEGVARRRTREG